MNLEETFRVASDFFAGRGDGSALSSSSHFALYPRVVRATWRESFRGLAPTTWRALSLHLGGEADGVVDAFFDAHPPAPRALARMVEPLGAFLVDEAELPPVFAELVALDEARRTAGTHEADVARARGVNPTAVLLSFRFPVSAFARALVKGVAQSVPLNSQAETCVVVRRADTHDVRVVQLTPPRLFAFAEASGETLPSIDDEGRRVIAAAREELIRAHVLLGQTENARAGEVTP